MNNFQPHIPTLKAQYFENIKYEMQSLIRADNLHLARHTASSAALFIRPKGGEQIPHCIEKNKKLYYKFNYKFRIKNIQVEL